MQRIAASDTNGPDAQALPDRTAQPVRFSRGLPGADAGGRAAGRGFAARRQELRLRLHHSAGVSLLLSFVHRHRAGPPEQAAGIPRRLVGQYSVCRGRHLSAVADGQRRADSERHFSLDLRASPKPNGRNRSATDFSSTELLDKLQPRGATANGKSARHLSAHSRRVRGARVPVTCSCWCWPASCC